MGSFRHREWLPPHEGKYVLTFWQEMAGNVKGRRGFFYLFIAPD